MILPLVQHATRRTIALPARDIEIALLDWGGDGPIALLHHANGFCKGLWTPVAAGLRERYRVIAIDARSHGDSSKPAGAGAYDWERFAEDLLGVAERLAADDPRGRIALGVGHSFGGTAMLGAAARRSDMFDRLILVDPVTPPSPGSWTPERVARVRDLIERARKRRSSWPTRAAARASLAKRELFATWHPDALELYLADGFRTLDDGSVELKCLGAIEAEIFAGSAGIDVATLARGVATPTLFLWAARGSHPRALYEQLAASMAHARVETVDAGHLAPMERPDLVVAAIERFTRGAARDTTPA